jgi:integrase/recombinase XerD
MFVLIGLGIILAAPTTWSTMMNTNDLPSCVEPYLDSFEQSFAAANYKPGTLKNYRNLVQRFGRLMDAEGIELRR